MRPHGSPQQLERRRRRALDLLNKGLTLSAVAAKLGCSVSSVHAWREAFRKGGDAALRAKRAPGRPPRLTRRQKAALSQVLLKGAVRSGYPSELWTTRRVAEVIRKRFGVRYHPNHMWRLLESLGWSCQKPEKRARERDEEAIERRKRYQWPNIKKRRKVWRPSGLPR